MSSPKPPSASAAPGAPAALAAGLTAPGRLPVMEWLAGEPVFDLAGLGYDEILEVLRPLSPRTREYTINRNSHAVSFREGFTALGQLKYDDMLEAADREELAASVSPLTAGSHRPGAPTAPADAAAREQRRGRSTQRQVNLKLHRSEFTELQRAAELLGLRPTQLARQLVLTGMRRIRYEHRVAQRVLDGEP